jgi:hypothetical protein
VEDRLVSTLLIRSSSSSSLLHEVARREGSNRGFGCWAWLPDAGSREGGANCATTDKGPSRSRPRDHERNLCDRRDAIALKFELRSTILITCHSLVSFPATVSVATPARHLLSNTSCDFPIQPIPSRFSTVATHLSRHSRKSFGAPV